MTTQCIKCKEQGTIQLRMKDIYCEPCFHANINHKFRSLLGKNKLMKSYPEKVLLALSGGWSSSTMLDLVMHAMKLDVHKRLRIEPTCFHIMGLEDNISKEDQMRVAKDVITRCCSYDLEVIVINLLPVEDGDFLKEYSNCVSIFNCNIIQEIKGTLFPMSSTVKMDYLSKVKNKILIEYAEKFKCNYIFTAETAVTLASNMLSNIVVGRGSQVDHDIGFIDSRSKVTILRPMKEITFEELEHYAQIRKLNVNKNLPTVNNNSLQSTINAFVVELQGNFPATVSTICKTADKLGGQFKNDTLESAKHCVICKSTLKMDESKLTALQATHFSSDISRNLQQFLNNDRAGNYLDSVKLPDINEDLCYGCSRTCSNKCDIKLFNKKIS